MDTQKKSPFFYGWVIAFAAFFIVLIGYGMRYGFSVFYVYILREFGWTRALTTSAFSLYGNLLGHRSLECLISQTYIQAQAFYTLRTAIPIQSRQSNVVSGRDHPCSVSPSASVGLHLFAHFVIMLCLKSPTAKKLLLNAT